MANNTTLRLNSLPNEAPSEDGSELQSAVARARRAFGLTSAPNGEAHRVTAQKARSIVADRTATDRQRRRFAQDSEVPVVYVTLAAPAHSTVPAANGNRIATLEAALETERHSRQQAERTLTEAQATLRELQTQLARTNIARAEAEEALRVLRAERAPSEARLAAERQARAMAELVLDLSSVNPSLAGVSAGGPKRRMSADRGKKVRHKESL